MKKEHQEYYYRLSRLKKKYLYYFVAGFVDGEGSFSIAMTKQKYPYRSLSWRWILNPTFQVYQHENHLDMLELLRDQVFMTGRIHRKSSPYHVFTYSIENHRTLKEKVIPFFVKYPLAVKDNDFKKFAEIIQRMSNKEHLSLVGFKRIVDIAFSMNAQGKQRKYSKEYIFATLSNQFN